MNIGIIRYGKMGRMIEQAALARGHRITAAIDPSAADAKTASGAPLLRVISSGAALTAADVFIEFTWPGTAPNNIRAALAAGKPIVCGSTGWYEALPEIAAAAEASGGSLLWSSNFSLGVNLFYRIAARAAALADPLEDYDVGGLEVHHNKKADSPSGTAKTLMEKVLAAMTRKTRVVWDAPQREAEAGDIHFASLRHGAVPGIHSLFFDSTADTIEITHTARNREGFASGALLAAEWLLRCGPKKEAGRPRRGVFTMDNVLETLWEKVDRMGGNGNEEKKGEHP